MKFKERKGWAVVDNNYIAASAIGSMGELLYIYGNKRDATIKAGSIGCDIVRVRIVRDE